MFHFGNAKAVDLNHLLSSIFYSDLEQHFCFNIVLKRVKQKVAANRTQLNFWSSKIFWANSKSFFSSIKKKVRELLFHLAGDFLCVQFLAQVLNQDLPSPLPSSMWNSFFLWRVRVLLGSLSLTVFVFCKLQSTARWFLCTTTLLALMAPILSACHQGIVISMAPRSAKGQTCPTLNSSCPRCTLSRNWLIWYLSCIKSRVWINTFYVTFMI